MRTRSRRKRSRRRGRSGRPRRSRGSRARRSARRAHPARALGSSRTASSLRSPVASAGRLIAAAALPRRGPGRHRREVSASWGMLPGWVPQAFTLCVRDGGSARAGSCRESGSGRSSTASPARPASAGWVLNDGEGVLIEAEGSGLDRFAAELVGGAPPLARVESLTVETIEPLGETTFRILASVPSGRSAAIPADVATCDDCLRDLFDPADRRYRYPFVNCTNCGPRFTIVRSVPYDRPNTTMAGFPMCPDCRREYEDPEDRRFHAEPVACPACGPRLSMPLEDAVALLREGGDPRGQGPRRLPPCLRRDERERGLPAPCAQAPRGEAARRDDRRPGCARGGRRRGASAA